MIKKFFLESSSLNKHKEITKSNNVYMLGGLIFLVSLIFIEASNFIKMSFFVIYSIGLLADKNFIKSASARLIVQFIIIFILIYFSKIIIFETRIIFLDRLISKELIGVTFTVLCILILMNGSNFIDGVNLNMIGYFLIISLILYYLSKNNGININIENLKITIFCLIIIYFFNMTGKIISGDSGAYLISIFFGLKLILFANNNAFISPYFIILLLWYPAFENLFSIIRKTNLNRSILRPDFSHFHQLLFLNLCKINNNKLFCNNLSGILINIYNLLILSFGARFIDNTQILIMLTILNVSIYLILYFKMLKKINS